MKYLQVMIITLFPLCTAVAEPFSDIGASIGVSVAAGAAGIGLVGLGVCVLVAILVCPKYHQTRNNQC